MENPSDDDAVVPRTVQVLHLRLQVRERAGHECAAIRAALMGHHVELSDQWTAGRRQPRGRRPVSDGEDAHPEHCLLYTSDAADE